MVSHKVRLKFAKEGEMRFISHLDLMRLFARAARRAGLPMTMTQGFNPHPRISIQPALKLGLESRSLEALFGLEERIGTDEIRERLRAELPNGIEILEVEVN
jgi:radical SAM-linked protein